MMILRWMGKHKLWSYLIITFSFHIAASIVAQKDISNVPQGYTGGFFLWIMINAFYDKFKAYRNKKDEA